MARRWLWVVLAALLCALPGGRAGAQSLAIGHTRFVLPNGLRVIVREDHREPVVAITLWYHVGSKSEVPGHSGLAHLFEHLMFEGSEHSRRSFMVAMEEIGASSINAVTNQDRTAFYEIVPKAALDRALWLEAGRMESLPAAIDQKALDAQRGVVQNEKKQGDDAPYAISKRLIAEHTYPPSHPYSRPVLGDMGELQSASLAEIRQWFATYYGPANAVLVLAGDIDAPTARRQVETYFGDLPPGPPVPPSPPRIEAMSGARHQTVRAKVGQPRLYLVWNIPPVGSPEAEAVDLAVDCLAGGKASRLSRALVDRGLADEVGASVSLNEIAGQVQLEVSLRAEKDAGEVERRVREQLAAFARSGPGAAELARAKTQHLADFARRMDRLVGTGSVSDRLAQGEMLAGGSDAYAASLRRLRRATPATLAAAARRWLGDGSYVLAILPAKPDGDAAAAARAEPPPLGNGAVPSFPRLQRATLANGLQVVLAERHELPVVDLSMVFDAGFAADAAAAPGTASLTAALLTEGTESRPGPQVSEALARLGAELSVQTDFDTSTLSLSAVRWNLSPSVALFADLLAHPAFSAAALTRQQERQLAAIRREQSSPFSLAMRALGGLLSPSEARCANRFVGTGSPESVRGITREDVARFDRTWFQPRNAHLVVTGDVTLDELTALLAKELGRWHGGPAPPRPCGGLEPLPARPGILLIDKPGAQQSFLLVAAVGLAQDDPGSAAQEVLVDALGGNNSSRLNLDLREEKHWTYGVQSSLRQTRGRQPFITYTSVQRDKTGEALREIGQQLAAVSGDRPIAGAELAAAETNHLLRLPASLVTLNGLEKAVINLLDARLPDDYHEAIARRIPALTPGDLQEVAAKVLPSDRLLWVVVGDRSSLEPALRDAGLGEVHVAGNL